MGGEKNREIESEMMGCGRGTRRTMNTKGLKRNQREQTFIKKTSSCFVYNRLSYREKETEVTVKRRFAEIVFAKCGYTGVRNFRFVLVNPQLPTDESSGL